MGVPGFFRWLIITFGEKYIYMNTSDLEIDSLSFDLNALIHKYKTDYINQINIIIDKLKPKKNTFIAIDGTTPIAKIKQQKQRRYKSIHDTLLMIGMKKKYNINIDKTELWNSAHISVGTEFMDTLCKNLHDTYMYNNSVIISDIYDFGEGEHKIMEYIRNTSYSSYIIYGNDADLFFLSFTIDKDIYIYRDDGKIISINNIKSLLINKWNNINPKNFIMLSYLLGNDFLPPIPSIDIYKNGIDVLLFNLNVLNIGNECLSFSNLLYIIEKLSNNEDDILEKKYFGKKIFPIKVQFNSYDEEYKGLQNLEFNIYDPIKLGKNGYKDRYYRYYNVTNIQDIVNDYIYGLLWQYNYYNGIITDYEWYYKYDIAPFLTDIIRYSESFNIKIIDRNPNITPLEQLLIITHPYSIEVIPAKYQHIIKKLNDYYNSEGHIDLLNKNKYWQCQYIFNQQHNIMEILATIRSLM